MTNIIFLYGISIKIVEGVIIYSKTNKEKVIYRSVVSGGGGVKIK